MAGWAETIAEVVAGERMPPWFANPEYGHFQNDARLSDGDKKLIATWVDNGCPEGNKADLPAPPKFVDGWQIPQPDVIFKMTKPYEVPDRGVIAYQTFELEGTEFPEDRWVQAAEVRPGNRNVVHHLALFYHPAENEEVDPAETLLNMVTSYTPGGPPTIYSPAACRRIPAGSKLMIQAHYTPNGVPQTDQSEVGLVFADAKGVKKEVTITVAVNTRFVIPAGAKDHAIHAVHQFNEDMLMFALAPHMHLRGKAFRFEAFYPDGREEVLLDVPRYDFNWQNTYLLAEPKPMPQGTEVRCTAVFDNSASNPSNPDPTSDVSWGDQTWQEMVVGTMDISPVEQDLSLGMPSIKDLGGGKYAVHFAYRPKEKVDAVYLAGSFNDWKTDGPPMAGPDAEGRYTARVELERGDYQYKFVLDGKSWRADPGNPDHAGQHQNSFLHIGDSK